MDRILYWYVYRIIVYIDAKIIGAAKKVGEQLNIQVETKKIGKQHYLYKDTTKWDREKRKRIKVNSKYICGGDILLPGNDCYPPFRNKKRLKTGGTSKVNV